MHATTTAPANADEPSRMPTGVHASISDDRDPNAVSEPEVDAAALVELAEAALGEAGVAGPAELAITLVDVDTITALNQEHLGGEGPTDVLSFPLEDADDPDPLLTGEARLIGDLVICPTIARANAPEHAGTFEDELALLCVHGILHILGWDHAETDDAIAMRAEEARILAAVHRPVAAGTEIPQ